MSADNSSDSRSSDDFASSGPKFFFLLLILLVGAFGNVILIITIGCNQKRSHSALYVFSINLAIINCVDCFFNMPVALTSTLAAAWNLGDGICRMNGFFMNLVMVETLLTLTFMALDRMMATKHTEKYGQIQSIPRIIIMIIYSWIQSLSFSIPMLFGAIPVKVYPDIYICMLSEKTSAVYTCVLILGCVLIPLIVTAVFFIIILKTNCSERSAVQNMLTQHQYSKDMEEPNLVKEMKGAKFAGVLFMSWLLMEAPFLIYNLIRVLSYSDDLNLESKVNLNYSGYVDIVLLWINYGYVIVLPILALLWKKELWQNFKNFILCRKSNLIVDMMSTKDERQHNVKLENAKSEEKRNFKEEKLKEAFVNTSGFQVPVLFATSNGVHIQTFGASDDMSESEIMYDDVGIRAKKCDVLGSQGNLQQMEDDTSDYDSSNEIDPFSVSHPISSKNIKDVESVLQRRSNSHPEVRGSKSSVDRKNQDPKNSSVTTTSAVDSGLDISSGKTITNSTLRRALHEIVVEKRNKKDIGYVELKAGVDINKEPTNKPDKVSECKHLSEHVPKCENINPKTSLNNTDDGHRVNESEIRKDMKEEEIFDNKHERNEKDMSSGVDDDSTQVMTNSIHSSTNSLQSLVQPSPKTKRKKKRQGRKGLSNPSNSALTKELNEPKPSPLRPPPRLKPLDRGLAQDAQKSRNNRVKNSSAQASIQKGAIYRKLSDPVSAGKEIYGSDQQHIGAQKLDPLILQKHNSKTSRGIPSNEMCNSDASDACVNSTERTDARVGDDVTTPSACTLVDIAKDLKKATMKREFLDPPEN